VPRAREMMLELRNKLAAKDFDAGEYYFKRNAFDSAIIYYEATVRDYADTALAPRALARLIDVYKALGYQEEEQQTRERLLREYPDSPEARALQPSPTPAGS
jgi:outer membrane protein assembly factor BamD